MAKRRLKKSSMKLKSSDGEEFVVDEEVMKEMETLKRMAKFCDDDDEDVPTCAITGRSLEKVVAWIKYQQYFENMDLKETFDIIIAADYLENERLSKAMLKIVFFKNNDKDVDEAANQYEDTTIVRPTLTPENIFVAGVSAVQQDTNIQEDISNLSLGELRE